MTTVLAIFLIAVLAFIGWLIWLELMNLIRRRREPTREPPPGVRFRISTRDGVIVDADSLHLHVAAKYGKYGGVSSCTPACLPGCDKHGWFNLIAGEDARTVVEEFSTVPLKIEIKPVKLG